MIVNFHARKLAYSKVKICYCKICKMANFLALWKAFNLIKKEKWNKHLIFLAFKAKCNKLEAFCLLSYAVDKENQL